MGMGRWKISQEKLVMKKQSGGKRIGSGRKKGSGKGRQKISKSISASESFWQKIDLVRGEKSRSKYIVDELNKS
jgi:hypothetical protein